MSSTGFDAFDRAAQTAQSWLRDVADAVGSRDRRFAYRLLRAWLHTLRDRLTVEAAADFAAGLPELIRGMYYDGWQPAKVPVKYGAEEYRLRFAREAGTDLDGVDAAAGAVTAALRARLAPGQLDGVLDQLPHQLRAILQNPAPTSIRPQAGHPELPAHVDEADDERLDRMQAQLVTLTEAVCSLARGLERTPYQGSGDERVDQAAHRAHELLLTVPATAQPQD